MTILLTGAGGSAVLAAEMPPGPTTTVPAPNPVDPYSAYVGQTTCDPAPKPGAQALLRLAMDHYKVGRNTGVSRACSTGGQSEHKEGRAFDWGLSVHNPVEKAAGDQFTTWLTAAGPDGKPGYNARRLGVMYVIWNARIWMASTASQGWRPYYGASPHTDHVHVSLSWNGAYKRTSWWTGSLVAQTPIGFVDSVTTNNAGFTVNGWTLDPDTSGSTEVHIYVDGVPVVARADRSRPDIGAVHGRGDRHGFSVTVPRRPGAYTVCTYGIDSDPVGHASLGCRMVVVPDSVPIGMVDEVTVTSSSITVRGWTLDPDTSASNEVHVYVDGVGAAVLADQPRPDVAAAFGLGDKHGYTYTARVAPGTHQVCVYGINTVPAAHTLLSCRSVGLTAAPIGHVDQVTAGVGGATVSGWALDPDTAGPTDVRIRVGGTATVVRADALRPDVARAHGRGEQRGFVWTTSLPPGPHTVCVDALNTGPGSNTELGCRDLLVPNTAPIGHIDTLRASDGVITVHGWALDPNTSVPIDVQVERDGTFTPLRADQPRRDVGAALGRGDAHGFTGQLAAGPGSRLVCVHAVDSTSGRRTSLGCRIV